MKTISIIVPVYNVDQYLRQCILSIVSQEACAANCELIVINDGSTDNSRNILAELQTEYPYITIYDKENGGLSSARNKGLEHASGEYILFVDSDDWIAQDSLSFLVGWIKKQPVDILSFNVCEMYDSGKTAFLASNLSPNNQISNIDDYLTNYTLRSSACMSLFARKLFTNSGLIFKEGFVSEDDDFIVRIASIAEQIVCNNKVIYYYRQRENSISKSKNTSKKIIADKIIILRELDEYIKQFDGKMRKGLERKTNFLAVDIIRLLIKKKHTAETIDKTLKELAEMNYYPLPKKKYSVKYKLFRLVFCYPYMIKAGRFFSKYI